MSPDFGRIAHIEDNGDFSNSLKTLLEREGHQVVANATNREQVVEVLPILDELRVNVVIVDGCLETFPFPGEPITADGEWAIRLVREQYPGVLIVGNAGDLDLKGANINSPKRNGDDALVRAISSHFRRSE